MREHLAVFDTTLRDGMQTPGLPSISTDAKVEIARMLERMRVDVIEAGFPAASDGVFEAVRAIASTVKDSTVSALALATRESVLRAAQALQPARRPRVHIFLGSSASHLRARGFTQESMVSRVTDIVGFAAEHFGDIEFSPEDAGRTEIDFLCRVVEAAVRAGATVINIPDTVGWCMPGEFGERIRTLRERVSHDPRKVTWSVHCHDDFGCATANTLAGVAAGARQIECTLFGIGERAGNTAMEEAVMAVRKRPDLFACDTRIDATLFWDASRLVERLTQVAIPRNKSVVGHNAFRHESGIHQAGVLKDRATYEVMEPAEVGWRGQSLSISAQSGRNGLRAVLIGLGIELGHNAFEAAYRAVMAEADRVGTVGPDRIRQLCEPFLRSQSVA